MIFRPALVRAVQEPVRLVFPATGPTKVARPIVPGATVPVGAVLFGPSGAFERQEH